MPKYTIIKPKNFILSVALCVGFASYPTIALAANNSATNNTITTQNNLPDFSSIYENVGKSVVNISVTQTVKSSANIGSSGDPLLDEFLKRMVPPQQQRQYKARSLGSGFVISSDGYILTNAHVVSNADTITVKFSDNKEYKATLIGLDTDTDVALIKIDAKKLPMVKIGNSNKLKPGNWVVAIGSPFGLENTITQGIVSAVSRNLPDDNYIPFIQTDVPINPGNSGGPLINLNGEIVGINSQIYSKDGGYMGISFAIPIDYAIKISDQLKATGTVSRGRFGITVQSVTSELAGSFGLSTATGALVNSVETDSAAAKSGVQVGDIILSANNQEITDSNILPRIVGQLGPKQKITLVIWRNNKQITLTAITMEAPKSDAQSVIQKSGTSGKVKHIPSLGIVVIDLSTSKLKQIGIKYGILIQLANDNAQLAGLLPNDVIIGVGNTPVTSINQFLSIIAKTKKGDSLALKITRKNGQEPFTIFVPITVGASKDSK